MAYSLSAQENLHCLHFSRISVLYVIVCYDSCLSLYDVRFYMYVCMPSSTTISECLCSIIVELTLRYEVTSIINTTRPPRSSSFTNRTTNKSLYQGPTLLIPRVIWCMAPVFGSVSDVMVSALATLSGSVTHV